MKKSLVALAVLGAAASAQAADISLYGVVDTGLAYTYEDNWGVADDVVAHTTDGESNLAMASGINASSRWGIRGSEDLGNGMKVGFKLESGISSDDGTLSQGGRLFGREASLSLSGAFGTISAGRMGGVGSSAGTYDYVYLIGEAFDGGDFNIWGMTSSSRYDNMITYETPEFAGVKVTAQYSFDGDTGADNDDYTAKDQHGDEGKTNVDRYASLAVTGGFGNLQFVGAYEYFNHASTSAVKEDGHLVHLGGNYDFGLLKLFAMGQYVKGARDFAGTEDFFDTPIEDGVALQSHEGFDGWGLHLGTVMPVAGGDWTVAVYYADGELDDGTVSKAGVALADVNVNVDIKFYGITTRYVYPLSERASLYAGAGYGERKYDMSANAGTARYSESPKEKIGQVYAGLSYVF